MAEKEKRPEEHILDLDDLVPDRVPVKFGGNVYHLSELNDFGPLELKKVEKMSGKVARLQHRKSIGDLTDTEAKVLDQLVNDLARMLVQGAPDAEVAKLDFWQKFRIISAFNDRIPPMPEGSDGDSPLSTTGS